MARFHHTVVVTALDRASFDDCAALMLDVVEATRTDREGAPLEAGEKVPGVRLVRGRHLRAGARCTVTSAPSPAAPRSAPGAPPATTAVRIREWRRSTGISVEQLLFRIPLRRGFRSGADEAAAWWNTTLGKDLPSPDALRAEFVEAMTSKDPAYEAPG
ncbi:hypothetical protein [Streptomyces atroolivaceus]|uniref:Uncharacterized protein n=1 Tax=Streptomyces atroolivaceus TaxID=66869 RepID=A0ABV9V2T3_STRAZ|nr:hypothetical protein [Streptomyces atroolivaceus]